MSFINEKKRRAQALKIGEIMIDVFNKINNWDPATCKYEELEEHYNKLMEIHEVVQAVADRQRYLQGVMYGRYGQEMKKKMDEFDSFFQVEV